MKIINTENAPKAIGAYSQGVEVGGMYYFSGQTGLDPTTMEMGTDFQGQLDQIMNNIDALLKAEDLNRKNVVKTTIFLKDLADFSAVNAAYESYFEQPYPARSCVEVSRLPKDALVEIEVIACKN